MHSTYNIKMGFCVVLAILGRREDFGHDKGSHHPPAYKNGLWERNKTNDITDRKFGRQAAKELNVSNRI